MNATRWEIYKQKNDSGWGFRLIAGNGKELMTSVHIYASIEAAENALIVVKNLASQKLVYSIVRPGDSIP